MGPMGIELQGFRIFRLLGFKGAGLRAVTV